MNANAWRVVWRPDEFNASGFKNLDDLNQVSAPGRWNVICFFVPHKGAKRDTTFLSQVHDRPAKSISGSPQLRSSCQSSHSGIKCDT